MAGSTYGTIFRIMTWGVSREGRRCHHRRLPGGLPLCEEDVQTYLNRRKPGQSKFATARNEGDQVEILSGVFEGKTTGTPIAMMVRNTDQRSRDYSAIKDVYRPGHADYCFEQKYGFRDYRGGGRSSARETIARVAAGAVACKLLAHYGITVNAYVKSIGEFEIDPKRFDLSERDNNSLNMPDKVAAEETAEFLERMIAAQDSVGGVVECLVDGMPAGVGEPVFDKLDARLAGAIMSIGAVKGFEIGDGFAAAKASAPRIMTNFMSMLMVRSIKDQPRRRYFRRHERWQPDCAAGGLCRLRPSRSCRKTANNHGENVEIAIKGRHDPVVVPRAVVVVEAMTALTIVDLLLMGKTRNWTENYVLRLL